MMKQYTTEAKVTVLNTGHDNRQDNALLEHQVRTLSEQVNQQRKRIARLEATIESLKTLVANSRS